MRAISLFSGIGGLDMGLEKAGIETVLQVEQDKHALAVLERHWPQVERLTDVRYLRQGAMCVGRDGELARERHGTDAERLRQHGRSTRYDVDLIHGGFPCQDISVAGKRAGLSGERSGLWFEFARVLEELRPRWVLIENVYGLLSSGSSPVLTALVLVRRRLASRWSGRAPRGHPDRLVERGLDRAIAAARRAVSGLDLRVVIARLEELGYGVAWRVVDAQHFGVPQRRRRVFIVGGPGDGTAASAVLAVGDGGEGHPAAGREAGAITTGALSAGTLRAGGVNGGNNPGGGYLADIVNALDNRRGGADDNEAQGGQLVVQDVAYALAASVRGTGDGHGNAWNSNYVAGESVRRLTPIECERLMGFPDGWTDGQADTYRYRQLGNAVVVPVAEWIGHRLVRVEELLTL